MATIHFLNVKEGDCSMIEHNSGHVTVIDVCNAKVPEPLTEAISAMRAKNERGIKENFRQKEYPVNPIAYMKDHGISTIFRYIQTHPDMDHMDGIKALFEAFSPVNFWDTDNNKEILNSSWLGSQYSKEDWNFYKRVRVEKPQRDPKRLALLSGVHGQFYNIAEDGSKGGDGLYVLAPTQYLVDAANEVDEEYNDCSYVLLYRTGGNRIVFGGDSHDDTWRHILAKHGEDVADIDLLIAPHHGRRSERSYEFLDTLKPTLTFFGNARSEYLAYNAWHNRGLAIVTNNQANCMVVDAGASPMILYVTHENSARRVNPRTFYEDAVRAWYVGPIKS